jgi:2-oxoglutarate ferredoxin oxidoreductase subunit gamma
MELKRIIIAGEGGQGIQSLAHIFTSAGFSAGKQVSFLPNFGVEQRGGVSLAFIQVADEDISFPKFDKADILVIFAGRAVKRVEQYIKKETIVIFDNSLISEEEIEGVKTTKLGLPATLIAKQKMTPRVFNIIMLGGLVAEIETIPYKKVEAEIDKFFAEKIKKEPQLKHFNSLAFKKGYEIVGGLKKDSKWREKILKK